MKKLVPDPPSASNPAPRQAWKPFELFSVRPGIGQARALAERSLLLGCIRHLTTEAELKATCKPAAWRGCSAPWPRR